jgi:hypothetical protein
MIIVILILLGARAYRAENVGLGTLFERMASICAVIALVGILYTGVYYSSATVDHASAEARVELLKGQPPEVSQDAVGESAAAIERKRLSVRWLIFFVVI